MNQKLKTKLKLPKVLGIYKGLPREIYYLFAARIISNLGRFISPLLTLILTQKIGMDSGRAGMLITLTVILQAPCVLLGGKLADTIGRKKVICTFFGLSALAYIICGFMPVSIELAYMLIVAACLASVPGAAYDAYVADFTTEKNRQASYSLLYMGMNVGAAIAPCVAGLLLENHLSILFFGDAVTSLLAVAVLTLNIRDKYDIRAIRKQNTKKAQAMKENVFRVLLETPELIFFAVIMMAFSFTYSEWDFGLPLCMSNVFGTRSSARYGALCTINGIMVIFITPLVVSLTRRFKVTHILSAAGLFYAGCFIVSSLSSHLFGFVVAIILLTLGEICCTVNYSTFVSNVARPTHLGRINSILSIISDIGRCASPLIIGNVIVFVGVEKAMLVVALIALLGAVSIYFLKYHENTVDMGATQKMI